MECSQSGTAGILPVISYRDDVRIFTKSRFRVLLLKRWSVWLSAGVESCALCGSLARGRLGEMVSGLEMEKERRGELDW